MEYSLRPLVVLFISFSFFVQCNSVNNNPSPSDENPAADEPELISPVNNASDQAMAVEFNWQKYSDVHSFRFQLSENAAFSPTLLDTIMENRTVMVSSLAPDTIYFWKIYPMHPSGNTKWSDVWTFHTGNQDTQPITADLISPEPGSIITPDNLTFTWKPVPDAGQYYFQIAGNHNFNESIIDSLISEETFSALDLEIDNEYQWRVTPVSELLTGHWSEISEFMLVSKENLESSTVTLLHPEDMADNQPADIDLQWEKIDDFETYHLQLSEQGNFDDTLLDSLVAAATFAVTELKKSTEYGWRVKPYSENLVYPWSTEWTFFTEAEIEIPKLTLDSPKHNSKDLPENVTFEWTPANGFDEYQFQLATNNSFSSAIDNKTIKGNSLQVNGLQPETTYFWRGRVVHENGTGSWSEVWSFSTKAASAEIPKVALNSPGHNATELPVELDFEWNKAEGFEEYSFQLALTSHFYTPVVNRAVKTNIFSVNDLQNETTYYWRVRIVHEDKSTQWSDVRSFTTEAGEDEGSPSPEIPKVVLSSPEDKVNDLPTELTFEWNKADGFEDYRFQLANNNNFTSPAENKNVKSNSISVNDLQNETTYYWRVRIVHEDKSTQWSDVRSFTTEAGEDEGSPSPVIPKVALTSPENNATDLPTELNFEWSKAEGFDNYRIQISLNSNFSSPVENKTVEATSTDVIGLEHARTYYWRVRIVQSGQNGPWSDPRTFTTKAEEIVIPGATLVSPSNNAGNLDTQVTFEWNYADGFDEYRFQLADNNNFSSPVENSNINSTSVTIAGLDYQRTYYWRVRIIYQGENGPWSQVRSFTTKPQTVTPPPPNNAFVSTSNGDFMINGSVFRFSGTNAYYLPNYEKIGPHVVNNAFDIFEATGINVVRMWAFYDGYDCGYSQHDSTENVIQTSPGIYSETALRDLDRVIAKGKERGIRFILPFINYWDELGGICQYNTWAGASNPGRNMAFFLSNSDTQKWYKDYISMLLNRVNTVTGVAYKNEPAIFAWQIMNEGRNSGANPSILHDWYREIAQYIKSIAPNHLVSTGEEGFDEGTPSQYSVGQYSNTYVLRANEGTSYIMNTSIPEIDFGNAHWYPADFGFGSSANSNLLNAQRAWLTDHQKIAADIGKPFVLGEWGYAGWANSTQQTIYDNLYQHAESINLDGNLLWQLTADGAKCWEFGGNICYPGGRVDTELYNSFKQHVQNIKP